MAQLETFAPKTAGKPAVKKSRIIKPAKLVETPYLETEKEVKQFLAVLEEKLRQAINNNERIEIR